MDWWISPVSATHAKNAASAGESNQDASLFTFRCEQLARSRTKALSLGTANKQIASLRSYTRSFSSFMCCVQATMLSSSSAFTSSVSSYLCECHATPCHQPQKSVKQRRCEMTQGCQQLTQVGMCARTCVKGPHTGQRSSSHQQADDQCLDGPCKHVPPKCSKHPQGIQLDAGKQVTAGVLTQTTGGPLSADTPSLQSPGARNRKHATRQSWVFTHCTAACQLGTGMAVLLLTRQS